MAATSVRLLLHLGRLLLWALLAAWQGALANPVSTENVTARLVAERTTAAPGDTLDLALVLDIRPGWHTYWENPGDSGEPPRIDWLLPEGVTAGPIRWPAPSLIRVGPLANYGYSGRAVHLIALHIPADWPLGQSVELVAEASWLVCEEHCIPENATLALSIPTADRGAPDPAVADLFALARERLPRPFAGEAALEAGEGTLRLLAGTAGLPESLSDLHYFPFEWGLIEHAAAQPWRTDDARLLVGLTRGPMADQASPGGVLVVEAGGESRAFALDPERHALPPATSTAEGAARDLSLPAALGFALLGGLILNLMPCVFPVLAMKALALARQGSVGAGVRAMEGLAYTAGVLLFFALIGALLLGLRAGGEHLGWGYQLQYPPFVALMAYLFFVLGLSLLGALTLGARLMGLGAARAGSDARGAFLTGALAALVAAPCTAPFMGAALGYAVTLSAPLALVVMLTLGLGLALPYLLLALIPGAVKILPKPGTWMDSLKQFLAFPLFATSAWLVWVLAAQTGPDGVGMVLAGLVILALGLWAWERTRQGTTGWRVVGGILAAGGLVAALALGAGLGRVAAGQGGSDAPGPAALAAEPFSPARLEAARAAGRPVLVNMTAAWCITCLVNERMALSSIAVAKALADAHVVYLKGDWTNRDPVITDYLAGFGRNGVPLYVYYPVAGPPRVLPQILTEAMVLDALGSGVSADSRRGRAQTSTAVSKPSATRGDAS